MDNTALKGVQNRTATMLVVLCVALLIGGALYYSYFLAKQAEMALKSDVPNPVLSGSTADTMIAAVKKFKEVPANEIPTVVFVTDISLLTPFGPARPGDVIFLYHQSNIAALYDPITRRLINIVPVNIKDPHAK